MFFKFLKKQTLTILLLTFFIIPQNLYAYSEYVIASGETVGIQLNSEGIIVVGSYNINGHNTLKESGLNTGDTIIMINDQQVNTIENMVNIIDTCNCDSLKLAYKRNNELNSTNLKMYNDNGVLKTGLYVKDTISGVGTLTYIDPETKLFGVLGHEITDVNTGNIIKSKDGTIFDSQITSITRSNNGDPGEKNAILFSDKVRGTVKENTTKGVFGIYTSKLNYNNLYKVADTENIKIGDAKILTVLDGTEVGQFSIKISSVKETKDNLKNIELEITDKTLLEAANGIIQGMSGSPIIQDNYIVGAVTHVVVDNPHKGYGILIKNMLEEGEN